MVNATFGFRDEIYTVQVHESEGGYGREARVFRDGILVARGHEAEHHHFDLEGDLDPLDAGGGLSGAASRAIAVAENRPVTAQAYATTRRYAGQRCSAGRIVVANVGCGPQAGIVTGIDGLSDVPRIWIPGASGVESFLRFVEAADEEHVLAMPQNSWCWPPRVT